MQELIKDGDTVLFLIEFVDTEAPSAVSFKVYQATEWEKENGTEAVSDTELYLTGSIKWDGCSHIQFGDQDGYLHLCGIDHWHMHKKVMDAVWDVCLTKKK